MRTLWIVLLIAALGGCKHEPGSVSLTKGALKAECDEAVFRAFENESAQFQSLYPDSRLSLRQAEARERTEGEHARPHRRRPPEAADEKLRRDIAFERYGSKK